MCGLFGIVNPKPKKFDYASYCVLGNENDSRGGDSCGMFIDGKVDYGVKTKEDKLFGNYFTKSELLPTVDKCIVAFGHCRKTSPGMVTNETQAQPCILKNKAGEIKFVVIHNGTINNYKELAKKYIPDVDITGMSDTMVMTRIFYYKGYDVLGEYQGGAVFVIADYREVDENGVPKVLLWKGVSKKSEYPINADPEDERPLEFLIHNGSLYFSSLGSLLPALLRGEKVRYTMYGNSLVQYTPGKGTDNLTIIEKYDRSKMIQSKTYSSSNSGYDYGYGYGYSYGGSSRSSSNSSSSKGSSSSPETGNYEGLIFKKSKLNRYMRKGQYVHGKTIMLNTGSLKREESKDTKVVWFFNGVALDLERGHMFFKFLEYLRRKTKLTPEEFFAKFENTINYLSFDKVFFKDDILMKATGATDCELFTGYFQALGEMHGKFYKDGKPDLEKTAKNTSFNTPFLNYENTKNNAVELTKLREECISLMN